MRQNLINVRTKEGYTIPQIAEKLGISERMYRYIEAGGREGKGKTWDQLQDLFGINQKELRATVTK